MAPAEDVQTSLEDELLVLAGTQNSDDEDGSPVPASASSMSPPPPPMPKKSPTPAPDSKPSNAPQKGVARKMSKRKTASRPTLTIEVDADDVSSAPASPNSLGSGAMSESDDEGAGAQKRSAPINAKPVGDGPLYPLEGKFTSETDKRNILSLPEARREQILAERMEEMASIKFKQQLRDLHETREKEGTQSSDKKKRSATAAELEEPERKQSKKSQPLDAYLQVRQQKHEERRQNKGRPSRRYSSNEASVSRSRSSSSVADDYKSAPRPDTSAADHSPSDLEAASKICLTRTKLPRVAYTPGFEHVAKRCFIRYCLGPHPQTGAPVYKLYLVHEVVEGKKYRMPSGSTKQPLPIDCDMYFVVRPGKKSKPVMFTECSDSRPTPEEWEAFKAEAARESIPIPSHAAVQRKLTDLSGLINYHFTDPEMTRKFQRQGLDKVSKNSGVIATAIENQCRRLEAEGDLEGLAKLEEEYEKVTGKTRTKMKAAAAWGMRAITAEDERIRAVNAQIRQSNTENARKAHLIKHHEQAKRRKQALLQKAKKAAEANAAQAKGTDGLFEGSDASRNGTPAPEAGKKSATPGKPVRKPKLHDDEIIGSLDLEIDVEI